MTAIILLSTLAATAQRTPNTNASYQQIRGLLPGGEVVNVKDLVLKRDAAIFTFHGGSFAFYGQVNGKITGAVFKGEGHLHLAPANRQEQHNLSILTNASEFDEDFDHAVLRFTDATAEELHKASTGAGAADHEFTSIAQQAHDYDRTKLGDNIDLRLLQDVLGSAPCGYFRAEIHGKKNHHLLLALDPHGLDGVAPEEMALTAINDWGASVLYSGYLASDVARTAPGLDFDNSTYRIEHDDLDTTIEKSGFLTALATVRLTAREDGLAVVPLTLHPTLRVSKVETEKGEQLDFVQEKKDEDADFGVLLAAPLKKGEATTLRIAYGGKDVVHNEGGSNYYPTARESWYPNAIHQLGNFTTYQMTFRVPKGMQLVATGTKLSDKTDGKEAITVWKTEQPLAMIGFNLGKFVTKEATVKSKQGDTVVLDAYANTELPNYLKQFADGDQSPRQIGSRSIEDTSGSSLLATLNTTSMLPVQLSQGQAATQIYTQYFGATPFAKIALTQQSACNYGQSWPMLVYLPICGFLDQTQQHTLGLDPTNIYWRIVTPHEVAHQWWGQTVGWRSYRDQWMSEGFANASAAIFLLATHSKPDEYREFWKNERRQITEKNAQGFRPIDVGPVTMGLRLSTEKTGENIYRNLVYPKGAYILHSIQMMMWNPREGDARFIETMHDFVATYKMKTATTEDFKAIVEKHMSPAMDLDSSHTMDWFFNEYVYGTGLPNYHFESQITPSGEGSTLHIKLTQTGVADNFKNIVPIYLEFADGKVTRLGAVRIAGGGSIEQNIPLPKLSSPAKRALINYYYDVLCTEN